MTCAEVEVTSADLATEAGPPRSPGLHLSQVIKSLMRQVDPKRFKGDGPPDPDRVEAGFSFEKLLEMGYTQRQRVSRPGEVIHDGIACSPDGIDGEWRVHEYKLTWMSSPPRSTSIEDNPKFWHWFVQIKAYCYVMGSRRALLTAFFVNGDYKGGFQPKVRRWDLTFETEELESNWRMITAHARKKGWL